MNKTSLRERSVRVTAWFLAVSYGLGGPLTAILEFRSHTLSERFDLPPSLIYLTTAVQILGAIGVLVRPLALRAAAALTVVTLGAIAAHLKIGSPETAIIAVVYTVVQIWFGVMSRTQATRVT
jgi:DoxX-like protein